MLPLTSGVPEFVLTQRGNYFLLIMVSRNREGGGWFYQSRRRRMVISERNDGGLIYVAETRNQPLIHPLPPDLGKGLHRLFKGKS